MSKFDNQVVWITGASSGIGKALALSFAKEGANLALSARRKDQLELLAESLKVYNTDAFVIPCDVTKEEQVEIAMLAIIDHFGKLDVAVANAGFGVLGKVEELHAADWSRQFETNVTGLAITAKNAIPHLKKTKGRLALIGSVAAYLSLPGGAAYGASKAAVKAIGDTLRLELIDDGVSCTTLHPGFVESNIARIDNLGEFDPSRTDKRPANLIWPTDKAADVMLKAIYKRKGDFVFTGHGRIMVFLAKYFPGPAYFLVRQMFKKQLKSNK